MRILCLHDQGSNARQLQSQLRRLGERLLEQYGIDLIYINAPLVMDDHENDDDDDHRVYMDGDAPFHGSRHDADHDGDVDGRPRTWWQTSSSSSPPPEPAFVVDQDDDDDENHVDCREQEQQHQQQLQQRQYLGLDASLLLLQQVWKTSYPSSIMGILGVGQGAQVGALLSLMLYSNQYESLYQQEQQQQEQQQQPNGFFTGTVDTTIVPPPPRFAIWINADSSLLPERERLTNEIECLHLLAANHKESSSSSSLLYQQFGGQVIVQQAQDIMVATSQDSHDSTTTSQKNRSCSDEWWTKATYVNHMGRFLLEQKRTLQKLVYASTLQQQLQPSPNSNDNDDNHDNHHNDGTDCRVLVLQQALIQAQHEASRMIAREIAQNPPAALMAIIQPTSVAVGANASLQRQRPAAGGAPCPSEFVLHRNKRRSSNNRHESSAAAVNAENDGEWASREHPSQRQREGDEKGQERNDKDSDVHMEGS